MTNWTTMKKIDILFENDDFLAINKPPGLLSVQDRFNESLHHVGALVRRIDPNYLLAHRLDKDTSGVMLVAKSSDSQRLLQRQFDERTITKEYAALVMGVPQHKAGIIDQPILPHEYMKNKMTIHKKGKSSVTYWQVEEDFERYTLLRLKPKTGRTHQIRVHLAHLGHSIVADPVYGNGKPFYLSSIKRYMNKRSDEVERPLISRTALHAEKITFIGMNKERISVSCPFPKDFKATINQLRKNR